MNSCAYCDADLGRSETMPELPARSVAYDPATQRVWSVCPKCSRWTLAPLEPDERASLVERLEHRYVAGAHAANVALGLAPLGDGTMVRVGSASWSQFAAWRYGRKMRRQRRLAWVYGVIAWGSVAWLWSPWGEAFLDTEIGLWSTIAAVLFVSLRAMRQKVVHAPARSGGSASVSLAQAMKAQVEVWNEGWRLLAPSSEGVSVLEGQGAVRALARLLPHMHRTGASERQVREAIGLIEQAGGPERLIALMLSQRGISLGRHELTALPRRLMLALEMASNEESELTTLRGEMAAMRLDLNQAAQTAAIAEEL
ncbi:MAG: hypothetical protein ACREOK_00420 [Gemmatimonadaceae bacterium]